MKRSLIESGLPEVSKNDLEFNHQITQLAVTDGFRIDEEGLQDKAITEDDNAKNDESASSLMVVLLVPDDHMVEPVSAKRRRNSEPHVWLPGPRGPAVLVLDRRRH